MRRSILLFFTIGGLFLGSAKGSRAEDHLQAILDKAIQAHGGAEKLARIQGEKIKSKGSSSRLGSFSSNGNKEDEPDFTRKASYLFPDRLKEDTLVQFSGGINFHPVVIYNQGKGSYRFSGFGQGSGVMSKDQLADTKEQLHRKQVSLRLVDLKDKTYTLQSLGEEKVADKPAMGVRVKAKGFRSFDLFFDKQTGLLVQVRWREVDPKTGKGFTEEELVTAHQKVDGVVVPKKIVVNRDGEEVEEEEFTEVKLLKTLDGKEFITPR